MKRCILTVILTVYAFFGIYGQNTTPIDLVLVLNTSSDMSSSYENVSGYITGRFLSEFLRMGDTFHLITFSGSPKLDAARRVSSSGDVETIIGRMLLQYPVERGNNIGAAIAFAEQYISSLPQRPKKIVLVSTAEANTGNLVDAAKQRLSSNTTLDFVQVTAGQPLTNLPSSGRAATRTTSTSTQRPAETVSSAPPVVVTETPTSPSQTPADTRSEETPSGETQISSQQTSTSEQSAVTDTPAGETERSTEAAGGQQEDSSPQSGSSSAQTVTSSSKQRTDSSFNLPAPFIFGIIILLLIVLGLIIFFSTRRLGSSPNRVMAEVSSSRSKPKDDMAPFVDHSKDLAQYAAVQTKQRSTPYSDRPIKQEQGKPAIINPSGPLLLNLYVEDQNTAIGKRNIHSLKSGYSLSVGGGQSDFFVFLVPIPPNIGEIRRNGSQCTFVPKKHKYFPDLGSRELPDCINKTIRVISDKNYELKLRFEMYEDPLVELNRVLMSVKVPG